MLNQQVTVEAEQKVPLRYSRNQIALSKVLAFHYDPDEQRRFLNYICSEGADPDWLDAVSRLVRHYEG